MNNNGVTPSGVFECHANVIRTIQDEDGFGHEAEYECPNWGTVGGDATDRFDYLYDPLTDTNWIRCKSCGEMVKHTAEEKAANLDWKNYEDRYRINKFWNAEKLGFGSAEKWLNQRAWRLKRIVEMSIPKDVLEAIKGTKEAHIYSQTARSIVKPFHMTGANAKFFLDMAGINKHNWKTEADKPRFYLSWAIKMAKAKTVMLKPLSDFTDDRRRNLRTIARLALEEVDVPMIECVDRPIAHIPANRKGAKDLRTKMYYEFDNDTGMDAGELPKPPRNPLHGTIIGCQINAQGGDHQTTKLDDMIPTDPDYVNDMDEIDLALIQNHRGMFTELKGKVGKDYDEQLFIDHTMGIDDTDTDPSCDNPEEEDNSWDTFISIIKAA